MKKTTKLAVIVLCLCLICFVFMACNKVDSYSLTGRYNCTDDTASYIQINTSTADLNRVYVADYNEIPAYVTIKGVNYSVSNGAITFSFVYNGITVTATGNVSTSTGVLTLYGKTYQHA